MEPSSEEASQSGAQVSGVKWSDGSSEGQSISFDFHLLRLTGGCAGYQSIAPGVNFTDGLFP